jgi:hypothetical protein
MHPLDHLDSLMGRPSPDKGAIERLVAQAATDMMGRIELAALVCSYGDSTSREIARTAALAAFAAHGESAAETQFWSPAQTDDEAGSALELPPDAAALAPGGAIRLFEEKFRNQVRRLGLGRSAADITAAAFTEMISNALEHAGDFGRPIAAFLVLKEERAWRFSVTDVGRGVRTSLSQNASLPRPKHDAEALRLALEDGISRTGLPGRGFGFTSVFKSLVDRQATVRLRTDSVAASWVGVGASPTGLRILPVGRRRGLHVEIQGRPI